MNRAFAQQGFLVDQLLTVAEANQLAAGAEQLYRDGVLLDIKKSNRFGVYNFQTLNGDALLEALPAVADIHERGLDYIRDGLGLRHYDALDNSQVGISLNRYPTDGGTFRRHFDSHEMTCLLMLQPAEQGGEIELYPNSKVKVNTDVHSSRLHTTAQKLFDKYSHSWLARRFVHDKALVKAEAGQGVFFHGGHSIHSALPVFGATPRIVLVFGYDLPHRTFLDRTEYYGYGTGNFK